MTTSWFSCSASVGDGAHRQLGAYGDEEKYTLLNPEGSFFVQAYCRHTPFAFAHVDYDFEQRDSVQNKVWADNVMLDAKMLKGHGDLLLGTYFRGVLDRLKINDAEIRREGASDNAAPDYFAGGTLQDVTSVGDTVHPIALTGAYADAALVNKFILYTSGPAAGESAQITANVDDTTYIQVTLDTAIAATVGDAWEIYDTNPYLQDGDEDLILHWCEEVGSALVKCADWKIGAQTIDSVTSEIIHGKHELHSREGALLRDAIGRQRTGDLASDFVALQTFSAAPRQLYVPLFTYGRAGLPLVALGQEQVSHKITLRGRDQLIVAKDISVSFTGPTYIPSTSVQQGLLTKIGMMTEVVFLSPAEQHNLCANPIDRYFEYTQGPQVARVSAGQASVLVDNLQFNHSITSLCLAYRASSALAQGTLEYFNFSTRLSESWRPQRLDNLGATAVGLDRVENPFESIELQLNSAPRVSRPGVYWHELGAHQKRVNRKASSHIMIYSFADDASDANRPSGALNVGRFSRRPVQIELTKSNSGQTGILEAGEILIWAQSQAVARIAGGKFALMWSTR